MKHYHLTYFESMNGKRYQMCETYFSRRVAEFVASIYRKNEKYSCIKVIVKK